MYRAVPANFWKLPLVAAERMPPNYACLMLYLATGPFATYVPGLATIKARAVDAQLDWPDGETARRIAELTKSGDALYDGANGIVWMPIFMEASRSMGGTQKAKWRKLADELTTRSPLHDEVMLSFERAMGTMPLFEEPKNRTKEPEQNQRKEAEINSDGGGSFTNRSGGGGGGPPNAGDRRWCPIRASLVSAGFPEAQLDDFMTFIINELPEDRIEMGALLRLIGSGIQALRKEGVVNALEYAKTVAKGHGPCQKALTEAEKRLKWAIHEMAAKEPPASAKSPPAALAAAASPKATS